MFILYTIKTESLFININQKILSILCREDGGGRSMKKRVKSLELVTATLMWTESWDDKKGSEG
ncbi:MAG: hypothetical protein N2V71_02420, partial [Methanophagales archaeon]|nr:hypothetical protein [Methanophagales archaeon]